MKAPVQHDRQAEHELVAAEYRTALDSFLSGAGEAALHQGYDVGRRAVAHGVGVLDMALIHFKALDEALLPSLSRDEALQRRKAANQFFLECLAPHEMAYRGFREANLALRKLNELLEDQARKMAHAVHDEAGQLLIAVHLALTELAKEVPARMLPRVTEVAALLGQIETDLRNLSHELRPTMLDDLGLVPALEFLADRVSQRANLAVEVQSSLVGRLPASVEVVLYRVIQEALANTARHAQAQGVKIRLQMEGGTLRSSISDDGVGFDLAAVFSGNGQHGLGLIGMRERLQAVQGTLQIESLPGRGTTLAISVPLEESNAGTSVSRR